MTGKLMKDANVPASQVCREAGIPYQTLMRWKGRDKAGKPLVERNGRRPVPPAQMSLLEAEADSLEHGLKRSAGAGELQSRWRLEVTRRTLSEAIANARAKANSSKAAGIARLTWTLPMAAWAMDSFEFLCGNGRKIHVLNIQDLHSRYKLPPLASFDEPDGESIAGHLASLFGRFGTPIFLKRDNGSNLNHLAVEDVLADTVSIPLNSPPRTPRYNGAIERSQYEFKRFMGSKKERDLGHVDSQEAAVICAELAAHELNHITRRSLGGISSCEAFSRARKPFSKNDRFAAYCEVREEALELLKTKAIYRNEDAAWRAASMRWLLDNELLRCS